MTITNHCKVRQNQRSISDSMILIALQYGQKKRYTDKVVLKRDQVDDLYESLFNLLKQIKD